LPGCVTQADTLDEIKVRLVEAVEGWLLVDAERVIEDKTALTLMVSV